MSNVVRNFLASSKGPLRMRWELHRKTRPAKLLPKILASTAKVRTELPLNVFGGDIFALFSNRLRGLLPFGEAWSFRLRADSVKRSWLPPSPAEEACPDGVQMASNPLLSGVPEGFVIPRLPVRVGAHDSTDAHPSPLTKNLAGSKEDQGKLHAPVLAGRLKEYWQLNGKKRDSKQGQNEDPSPERRAKGMPPLPVSPPSIESVRSWPEGMARQLSQRMTSMITGQGNPGLSKQTQQKVYSGLPDRVEIQNIFHVDVKSIDGSGAGSLGDLSDKIAQILREEALQHGIDIT